MASADNSSAGTRSVCAIYSTFYIKRADYRTFQREVIVGVYGSRKDKDENTVPAQLQLFDEDYKPNDSPVQAPNHVIILEEAQITTKEKSPIMHRGNKVMSSSCIYIELCDGTSYELRACSNHDNDIWVNRLKFMATFPYSSIPREPECDPALFKRDCNPKAYGTDGAWPVLILPEEVGARSELNGFKIMTLKAPSTISRRGKLELYVQGKKRPVATYSHDAIRRTGKAGMFLYIELGRRCRGGPGLLWMHFGSKEKAILMSEILYRFLLGEDVFSAAEDSVPTCQENRTLLQRQKNSSSLSSMPSNSTSPYLSRRITNPGPILTASPNQSPPCIIRSSKLSSNCSPRLIRSGSTAINQSSPTCLRSSSAALLQHSPTLVRAGSPAPILPPSSPYLSRSRHSSPGPMLSPPSPSPSASPSLSSRHLARTGSLAPTPPPRSSPSLFRKQKTVHVPTIHHSDSVLDDTQFPPPILPRPSSTYDKRSLAVRPRASKLDAKSRSYSGQLDDIDEDISYTPRSPRSRPSSEEVFYDESQSSPHDSKSTHLSEDDDHYQQVEDIRVRSEVKTQYSPTRTSNEYHELEPPVSPPPTSNTTTNSVRGSRSSKNGVTRCYLCHQSRVTHSPPPDNDQHLYDRLHPKEHDYQTLKEKTDRDKNTDHDYQILESL